MYKGSSIKENCGNLALITSTNGCIAKRIRLYGIIHPYQIAMAATWRGKGGKVLPKNRPNFKPGANEIKWPQMMSSQY